MKISPLSPHDIELAAESSKVLSKILKKQKKTEIKISIQMEKQESPISVIVPLSAFEFLNELLKRMEKGKIIDLPPLKDDFTIQEAADFINVEESYLVNLLREKQIPFYKVDSQVLIKFEDINEYKEERSKKRRKAL